MICVAIHDFSTWLRTGSNPADINRSLSHANKMIFSKIVERDKAMLVKLILLAVYSGREVT